MAEYEVLAPGGHAELVQDVKRYVSENAYVLPPATDQSLGGVTVGDGLDVSGGNLSVKPPKWEVASANDGSKRLAIVVGE